MLWFDPTTWLLNPLLGGTVQITFDGFAPELSDPFQLLDLTGGTASSWFSSVVAPEGWNLSTDGKLCVGPCSVGLSGDFNDDNTVDLADLNLVLFNWDQPANDLPLEWTIMRPSNNVGLDELNQVLFNWGETTIAPSVVPEPGTVSLAAIAGLLMLCCRSRRRRPRLWSGLESVP